MKDICSEVDIDGHKVIIRHEADKPIDEDDLKQAREFIEFVKSKTNTPR